PPLARRPARAVELRPRADRPRRLVQSVGGGPASGVGPRPRGVRLLQQPLGRALAGERERDEASLGAGPRRAAPTLAAARAVPVSRPPESPPTSHAGPGAPATAVSPGPAPASAATDPRRDGAGEEAAPRAGAPAIAFIFVTVMIDVLAMGLIIPVLPRLVQQFVG